MTLFQFGLSYPIFFGWLILKWLYLCIILLLPSFDPQNDFVKKYGSKNK